MRFTIDIEVCPDGRYEARCVEIGLSESSDSLDDLLKKVRELLVYHITTAEDAGMSHLDEEQLARQLNLLFKDKNFHLPRNPKVH